MASKPPPPVVEDVFLDTCEWEDLDFGQATLAQRLLKHVRDGRVRLHITSVTTHEVFERIHTRANRFAATNRELANAAKRLGQPILAVENPCADRLNSEFLTRLALAKTHDASAVDVNELVSRRYEKRPPFSAAKKSEWPDAVAGIALRSWAQRDRRTLSIVSRDNDWVAMCDEFAEFELAKLGEVVGRAARKEKEPFGWINKEVTRLGPTFEARVSEIFADGLYPAIADRNESEAEVTEVTVRAVNMVHSAITEVDDVHQTVSIGVEATIFYDARVQYGDNNSIMWDSDDRSVSYTTLVKKTVHGEDSFRGELEYTWFSDCELHFRQGYVENGNGDVLLIHVQTR